MEDEFSEALALKDEFERSVRRRFFAFLSLVVESELELIETRFVCLVSYVDVSLRKLRMLPTWRRRGSTSVVMLSIRFSSKVSSLSLSLLLSICRRETELS